MFINLSHEDREISDPADISVQTLELKRDNSTRLLSKWRMLSLEDTKMIVKHSLTYSMYIGFNLGTHEGIESRGY